MLSLTQTTYFLTNHYTVCLIIANYTLLTLLSFLVFYSLKVLNISNATSSTNEYFIITLFNLIFFLNLAGLPPLPGFFIKLNFLINIINYINIYLVAILVVFNFTIFYFYIQFYKNIYAYSSLKRLNLNKESVGLALIFAFTCINFYPVYNLMVLFIL